MGFIKHRRKDRIPIIKSRGNRDDAAAEITAFILISAIIVAAVACFAVFYLPIAENNIKAEHDKAVLQQFFEMKNGIDILWISDAKGSSLEYIIPLSTNQKTDIFSTLFSNPRQSTGTINIKKGALNFLNESESSHSFASAHNISPLYISYSSSSDNSVIYDGGALFYGKSNMQNEYYKAADATLGDDSIYIINASICKDTLISGNEPIRINLKYLGTTGPYKPGEYNLARYASNKKINNVYVSEFEIYASD